ncbi:MAG: nuclear transport factor 2 family protein [Roseibium sp.]|uniref:nuclear transport factor 2 family protein n=1 Tax=Roseibium sp. TaxID=1936156 RepID=UPI003D9C38DB
MVLFTKSRPYALVLALIGGLFAGAFTSAGSSAAGKEEKMSPNKLLLTKAMDALFRDFSEEDMRRYYTADYIQHNPSVPTGLDAVIGLLPVLKGAGFDYETHRMIEDGDLLLTHTTYSNAFAFGAETVVAFDLWRVENGRIAEHWDAIIPLHEETASGRSQTDGMTDIVDIDKTEENKKLVEAFVREVLIGGNVGKMSDYIKDGRYDQHNPVVKDGPDALAEVLDEITNTRIHRIVGEGNFVLTQSEGSWNGVPMAIYDLFRVENGAIVEHWDVLQEIPTEMAHQNGMF